MIPELEYFYHEGSSPIPLLLAQTLGQVPTLVHLFLHKFAADSLPSFAAMQNLKRLEIDCSRHPITESDMLPHSPVATTGNRRSLFGGSGPTVDTNVDAIAKGLAEILIRSSTSLETLEMVGWETGDWLQKLCNALEEHRGAPDVWFPALASVTIRTPPEPKGSAAIGTLAFPRFLRSIPALERLLLTHTDMTPVLAPLTPLLKLKTL